MLKACLEFKALALELLGFYALFTFMNDIANSEHIHIEVAYATPKEQLIIPLKVPITMTAEQVIEQSEIVKKFPEIDLKQNKIGIFSKPCALNTQLRDGDRIEIYRPLLADPKEIRKRRAAQGKRTKKGN